MTSEANTKAELDAARATCNRPEKGAAMQKQNQPFDPNDPDRKSDILTIDGKPIENSSGAELDQERRKLAAREKSKP